MSRPLIQLGNCLTVQLGELGLSRVRVDNKTTLFELGILLFESSLWRRVDIETCDHYQLLARLHKLVCQILPPTKKTGKLLPKHFVAIHNALLSMYRNKL